jgi:hypothetical protein
MPPVRSAQSFSIPGKTFTLVFVLGLIGVLTISIPAVMVFEQAQGKIEAMREAWPSAWEEGFRERYKQIDRLLEGASSSDDPSVADFSRAWQACRQQMQRSPMMDEQLPAVIEAESLLTAAPRELEGFLQSLADSRSANMRSVSSFLNLQEQLSELPKTPLGRIAYPILRLKHPPLLRLSSDSDQKSQS